VITRALALEPTPGAKAHFKFGFLSAGLKFSSHQKARTGFFRGPVKACFTRPLFIKGENV
jgi:hypothetical protein